MYDHLNTILKKPISTNSKSKIGNNYLMDVDVISSFVASKGKKVHKIDKNS